MAYDKVIDSAKLDGAMSATADAIRGKTGGTAQIAWNESTGFASAVDAIEATEAENLTDVLDEQEALIATLQDALRKKTAGSESGETNANAAELDKAVLDTMVLE